MFSLLSAKKSFDDRWIGDADLGRRHDLHVRRMRLAAAVNAIRRAVVAPLVGRAIRETIRRDGFAIVPDLLDGDAFARLSREVEAAVARAEADHPPPGATGAGYGAPRPFPGGTDRYDGGTLNRFLDIDPRGTPEAAAFGRREEPTAFTRAIVGRRHDPHRTLIYLTRHGEVGAFDDIQSVVHRDTFFSSMKFWFFLRPVRAEDGPFEYHPGTHRLDARRLDWERCHALGTGNGPRAEYGGSFRASAADLEEMGVGAPVRAVCDANTLVIADTLGWHRRGDARPGAERLAIYGWHRPTNPFFTGPS